MMRQELETSTQEQAGFEWAQLWMEEGGSLVLDEGESQSLLTQVFSLNPFIFCSI